MALQFVECRSFNALIAERPPILSRHINYAENGRAMLLTQDIYG